MWPDWVWNSGPLTYESGALPLVPCGPAVKKEIPYKHLLLYSKLRRIYLYMHVNTADLQ